MIKNIVNLNKSITSKYFKKYTTPWEILNNLKNIIKEIDKSKTKYLIRIKRNYDKYSKLNLDIENIP